MDAFKTEIRDRELALAALAMMTMVTDDDGSTITTSTGQGTLVIDLRTGVVTVEAGDRALVDRLRQLYAEMLCRRAVREVGGVVEERCEDGWGRIRLVCSMNEARG